MSDEKENLITPETTKGAILVEVDGSVRRVMIDKQMFANVLRFISSHYGKLPISEDSMDFIKFE